MTPSLEVDSAAVHRILQGLKLALAGEAFEPALLALVEATIALCCLGAEDRDSARSLANEMASRILEGTDRDYEFFAAQLGAQVNQPAGRA